MRKGEISPTLSEEQVVYLRGQVESHVTSLRVNIASAVERGEELYGDSGQTGTQYARYLVGKLRKAEDVFRTLNASLRS